MNKILTPIKDNIKMIVVLILVIIILVLMSQKDSIELANFGTFEDDGNAGIPQMNYKVNEYKIINITEFDLLDNYLRRFIRLELNNPAKAFEYLSKEEKTKYNNSVEEFEASVKKSTTIFTKNNKLERYGKDEYEENVYYLIDSENIKYTLIEHSTWDFEIIINGKI